MSETERMDEGGFASLAVLQKGHGLLVTQVGKSLDQPEKVEAIIRLVRRAVATGRRLEDREERAAAQGIINFWSARLGASSRRRSRRSPTSPRRMCSSVA